MRDLHRPTRSPGRLVTAAGGLAAARRRSAAGAMTAIVLLALNLRTLVASLPPLLTHVQADLGLSGLAAGLLTTLPVLAFGAFAPLAPRLTRRVSIERVLLGCALPTAAAAVLRGAGGWAPLFAGCALAGLAVALAQARAAGVDPPAPPGDHRPAHRRVLDVPDPRRGARRGARRAARGRARLVGGVARGLGAAGAGGRPRLAAGRAATGHDGLRPAVAGAVAKPAGVERQPVHGRAVDGVLRRAELAPDRARGRGLLEGRGGHAAGVRRPHAARAGVRRPGAGGTQPQSDRRAVRDRRVLARRRARADRRAGRRARVDRACSASGRAARSGSD